MCVTMQREIVTGSKAVCEVARIVHHDDVAFSQSQFERWVRESEVVPVDHFLQGISFLIVVAKDTVQLAIQTCEFFECFSSSDVACVDDSVHLIAIEKRDDLFDVFEIVVGVAYDADFHTREKAKVRIAGGTQNQPICTHRGYEADLS